MAGHTARRNDNRWTKRIWTGNQGQEKGKEVDREEDGGTAWAKTARNRNEWHLHEEGY